jgi:hypothetical protein
MGIKMQTHAVTFDYLLKVHLLKRQKYRSEDRSLWCSVENPNPFSTDGLQIALLHAVGYMYDWNEDSARRHLQPPEEDLMICRVESGEKIEQNKDSYDSRVAQTDILTVVEAAGHNA